MPQLVFSSAIQISSFQSMSILVALLGTVFYPKSMIISEHRTPNRVKMNSTKIFTNFAMPSKNLKLQV